MQIILHMLQGTMLQKRISVTSSNNAVKHFAGSGSFHAQPDGLALLKVSSSNSSCIHFSGKNYFCTIKIKEYVLDKVANL